MPTIISEANVRRWGRGSENDCKNVHDEKRSGRSSSLTEGIVEHVNRKLQNDRRLTISALDGEFFHVGRTSIFTIVSEMFRGYRE